MRSFAFDLVLLTFVIAPPPLAPPPPPKRLTFDLEELRFRAFVVGSFFCARAELDNIGGSAANASRIAPAVRAVKMYRYIISSHGTVALETAARREALGIHARQTKLGHCTIQIWTAGAKYGQHQIPKRSYVVKAALREKQGA